MKKAVILFMLFCLVLTGRTFANENTIEEPVEITASNTMAPQTTASNVEKIVTTTTSVGDFITARAISGIETNNPVRDTRTCVFCWIFAAVFAVMLYEYGEKLKTYKKGFPKNWYVLPILYAIGIFAFHGVIHTYLESSFFLRYYWMILFDLLIVAYVWYVSFQPKKKTRSQTASV